jgi:hypothetical protein
MKAPSFPEFKPVGLEDRPLISKFIMAHPSDACEVNFTNIFIWRHFERSRYTLIRSNLCVLCEPPDEPPYFLQPLGAADLEATIRDCLDIAPRLSRVPEDFVIKHCRGLGHEADPDNFDYVYRTDDLIQLRGKKYDGKRNRIRKFEKSHQFRYLRLTPGLVDGCRTLFEEWFSGKASHEPAIRAERAAILEALAAFELLGLIGGAIEVDRKIVAFSMGEKLTSNTAVIHIEIANPEFPGLAQLINREFIRNEWSSFEFVNREQDVGMPGLRRAKCSYYPHHLVRKYTIAKCAPISG